MSDQTNTTPSESDVSTTIAELREAVREFVSERNWEKFHAPKNLAMALAIEAAELMEHFQWLDVAESRNVADESEKRGAIAEEIADVLCYTIAMANELDLDITTIFRAKMVKNVLKYPADQFRGRYGADDKRPVE